MVSMFIDHDSDVCYSWVSIKVAYGLAIQYPVDKDLGRAEALKSKGLLKAVWHSPFVALYLQ